MSTNCHPCPPPALVLHPSPATPPPVPTRAGRLPSESVLRRTVQGNIETLRRRRGLTQQALADATGYKRPLVGAWCEGRSMPTLPAVLVLCRLFNVPVEDFLTRKKR